MEAARFERARVMLKAELSARRDGLDPLGRARLLDELTRAPEARTFVLDGPSVDVAPIEPLLEVLAHEAGSGLAAITGRLAFAALIDARRAMGWPELQLGAALLDLDLGTGERWRRRLAELASAPAEILRDLGLGLGDALRTGRLVEQQDEDDEGRPLFVGPDGCPTTKPTSPSLVRDHLGEVLFLAPPEMRRDPYVRGYSYMELWERHFIHAPHGDVKLEAWVKDARNALSHHAPNPPKMRSAIRDPAREQAILEDVDAVLGEVALVRSWLAPLGEAEESSLVTLNEARELAEAAARSETLAKWTVEDLARYRAELEPDAEVVKAAPRLRFEVPSRVLSPGVRRLVAARSGGTLLERLEQAAAIANVLSQPAPRSFAALPLRPALSGALDELLGGRDLSFPEPLAVAHRARFVVPVLEAQAIADRGERALRAVGKGEGPEGEATRMAEELALVHLRRAVTETAEVTPIARAGLGDVLPALDALLGHRHVIDVPLEPGLADVLPIAAACLHHARQSRERLLHTDRDGPVVIHDLRSATVTASGWPLVFPVIVEALRARRPVLVDDCRITGLSAADFLRLLARRDATARAHLGGHVRHVAHHVATGPVGADHVFLVHPFVEAHGFVVAEHRTRGDSLCILGSGQPVHVVIDPHRVN